MMPVSAMPAKKASKTGNIACIILAAGRGTRMKSSLPKVLHTISGKTMIEHMLGLVKPFNFRPTVVVTGYGAREVARCAEGAVLVRQRRLLGSADAVKQVKSLLTKKGSVASRGDVLILYGDTPLIRKETLRRLIERQRSSGAACTLLTARLSNPTGYGRILRDSDGSVTRIAEEKDASAYEKAINEVNIGVYCFDVRHLFDAIQAVRSENKKREYYLTDVISILRHRCLPVETVCTDDEEEAIGVNSKRNLARVEDIIRRRAINRFLLAGITIEDPRTTHISGDCVIGKDTVIRAFTLIEGDVKIGSGCVIGPFARLRSGTKLSDGVEIGNFVEITRSSVGARTKIKHHSYIGDSVIGKDVNIGAGTITANYDGRKKNRTVIKDGVFVGSGTVFVAPVTVGKNAVTGAGCVVTRNTAVPNNAVMVGVPARLLRRKKT